MPNKESSENPTFEQFKEEWLVEIKDDSLSPFERGVRFGAKIVTQWLGVSTDDEDFMICDGSGDGGIDIAYLQRGDNSQQDLDGNADEGDTWYLIQSKYGTAFSGEDTILKEGIKVIRTLQGETSHLSNACLQLLTKLDTFRKQASNLDRIVLVFATVDRIPKQDRPAIDTIKARGREAGIRNFDVEEVSLQTIWEDLDDVEQPKLSVSVKGQFAEQYSGLLVGTVSLIDLFEFLKAYKNLTGDLDQIYEKNVRKFLGNRRKINMGITSTLEANPEKFGLYNNGITIVVSGYSHQKDNDVVMHDPYIVNGCQTTRSVWQVLDSRLNAGGTGDDPTNQSWIERVNRGGVVTKIVRSDEAEITNITRYTNSQNAVRERDFIALHTGFQKWAQDMKNCFNIYMEIQRGGTESQKAWEKQHPEATPFETYVNAFDLVKVFGAGWLGEPGTAFGRNAPFLPGAPIYERMVSRSEDEEPFGARDLYAAYIIKSAADDIGFGRVSQISTRRLSRFLFYHIMMRMLHNVILVSPELQQPNVSTSVLTDAVIRLNNSNDSAFTILQNAAIATLDQYLTPTNPNSAHNEHSFREIHNGDLNAFLKAPNLGKETHSPLLAQWIAQNNLGFASIPMPTIEGSPTQREYVVKALLQ